MPHYEGLMFAKLQRGLPLFLPLSLCGCPKSEPAPTAAPSATPVATASVSGAPIASAPPAPVASSVPEVESCFSPEKSQEYAKPRKNAAPPFEECAAGIFSHCEPDHSYCSIALDVARTQKKRAVGQKLCCYGR